jgi:hypothetical protein
MAGSCGRRGASLGVLSFSLRSLPPERTDRDRVDVALWHKCEVAVAPSNVRVWRRTGKHLLARSISHFDPNETLGRLAQQVKSEYPAVIGIAAKIREYFDSRSCGDCNARLAVIFLMLFIHNACAQDGVLRMDQVVGTWRLIAASALSGSTRNDAPYGPTPSGLITYTSDGRVMAIICHSGRKPLASGDRISASTDERAEAFATSFSYAGHYSLSGSKIIHRVELASVQNWVDTDLVRLVRLDDNKITLTTPPISVGGEIRTTELVRVR